MCFLADFGLPMIIVQMPVMVAALIPIIVIEALVVRTRLALTHGEAFKGITIANVASTLLGIPVAWVAVVIAQQILPLLLHAIGAERFTPPMNPPLWYALRLLLSFGWLFPDKSNLYWMVPVASAMLLIPSYFASVWIERPICRRFWRSVEPIIASRAVTIANRISYAALFAFACGWLIWKVLAHK